MKKRVYVHLFCFCIWNHCLVVLCMAFKCRYLQMVEDYTHLGSAVESEWEEQHVFVELVGMVDPDKLAVCCTENSAILVRLPIRCSFKGSCKGDLGTVVIFCLFSKNSCFLQIAHVIVA